MTRGKKLLILLGALAIVVVAVILIVNLSPKEEVSENEEISQVIYAVDTEGISKLAWTYNGQKLTVEKEDESWVYSADKDFPLDETYINSMLEAVSEITSSKTISESENMSEYGLDNPATVVEISQSGEMDTINFGNTTSLSGEYYTDVGDGNVYLVATSVPEAFQYNLMDIVRKEDIPSMSDVTGIHIKNNLDDITIEYKENSGLSYSDSYVWFRKDGNNYSALDTESIENLLAVLQDLTWGNCVEYNADEADLAEYGLDNPDAVASVTYGEGEVFEIELASPSEGEYYVRISGSGMIYGVDETVYNSLAYTTANDLQPDEVIAIEWNDVTKVDVTLNGVTYTFEKEERTIEAETVEATETEQATETTEEETEPETEVIWTLNGEEVELAGVLSTISGLTSTGFTGGIEPTREADITIKAYRKDGNYKEVTLAFHTFDSESSITVLNGTSTVFVARENIVELIEKVNSLVL